MNKIDKEQDESRSAVVLKSFILEARERGFLKKVNKKLYKNDEGDVCELRAYFPYTVYIKFKEPIEKGSERYNNIFKEDLLIKEKRNW